MFPSRTIVGSVSRNIIAASWILRKVWSISDPMPTRSKTTLGSISARATIPPNLIIFNSAPVSTRKEAVPLSKISWVRREL
ncbi:hypothetical protein ANTRET_LOCUS3419 [Anthophora retusa]